MQCRTFGVRTLRTISELSRRHQVTVLTTHGPDDDPEGLARHLSRCHRVISLPLYPDLHEDEQDRVMETARSVLG